MLVPVRVEAPDATPVSLAEAKAHLEVDTTHYDTLISAMIASATEHLDGYTGVLGRAIMTQSWRQDFAGFGGRLSLPIHPVESITSITYYDENNAQQTLATSVYELQTDALGPYVALKPNQTFPGTYSRADAVSVTFDAGADEAPAPIKAAILLMVGDLYRFRETAQAGATSAVQTSTTVDALIRPYRRIGV
jgi:uncharacterized phiE125 gp8 family phage protein